MENQGKRLRAYIQSKDLSFSQVSRRLGHGSKNTLHNWFDREELSMDMFSQLASIFPSIMNDFPEVEWKKVNSMAQEEAGIYGSKKGTTCEERLERLMNDHLELLKMYNQLSMKYVELVK